MMRYLHIQAQPIMRPFAKLMFNGGRYSFLPDQTVPTSNDNNLQGNETTRFNGKWSTNY